MSEEGAGSVLAVGIVAAVVTAFVAVTPVAIVLDARHRATAAADAAALAAGDAALGVATGVPCRRAAEVVTSTGVGLASCAQHGVLVRVATAVDAFGFRLTAVAVAGPPSVPRD